MKRLTTFIFIIALAPCLAQDINLEKRYSFAKSYFGLDFSYFHNLQESVFLDEQNQLQPLERSNFITPAINIGATHFWGHADFFVSIATSSRTLGRRDELDHSIRFRAIQYVRFFQ
ncbi:MAG: hypothetical protein HC912_09460 [Saprospiraceae bacterium]|nr:hypothetical protein [Saprospiraceae bacterium]